jgi:hypothetical protein
MTARWITAALLLLAWPLVAQEPDLGDRVRVQTVDVEGWWYGAYQGVTNGKILVRPEGDDVFEFPLQKVVRLEVYEGRRGHALAGMGLGLAGGALLGAGLCSALCEEGFFEKEESIAMAAVAGALTGTLVGGVLGAAVWRTDKWEPVELPAQPMVSVSPSGRFGVRVSIPLRR